MNYTITRDGQQYGPYTLGDLQRYVSSGEVLLTDMAFAEGMSDPVPVSQIVGNIAVPAPSVSAPVNPASLYPNPPNLHWGLVLLFAALSCGLFSAVWGLVLSSWLKKVAPDTKALYYYIAYAVCLGGIFLLAFGLTLAHMGTEGVRLVQIVAGIVGLFARFSFRSSMEDHYNNVEGIPLTLSGVMTFFFSVIYFQYHVNDIVRRKQAEGIVPVVS